MILTGANMEKTGRAQHSPGRLTARVILDEIQRREREADPGLNLRRFMIFATILLALEVVWRS